MNGPATVKNSGLIKEHNLFLLNGIRQQMLEVVLDDLIREKFFLVLRNL